MVALQAAERFRAQALAILSAERDRLAAMGVDGELDLVGGSSVAGALTKGDVDLHLRVDPTTFAATVTTLESVYAVVHPQIWGPTLATFEVPARLPTGLAATPVGSEHDTRFRRCWQLLAADPALVAEYNAAKLAADTQDDGDYERRKSMFFDHLVELWTTHPAGRDATDR